MRRSCTDNCLDFADLTEGRLPIESRFRLGRHIRVCQHCKLMLLIILDDAERTRPPGQRDIKALAVMADVDAQRIADWLLALFSRS